eukprot:5258380-Amphidinium_carterae.1
MLGVGTCLGLPFQRVMRTVQVHHPRHAPLSAWLWFAHMLCTYEKYHRVHPFASFEDVICCGTPMESCDIQKKRDAELLDTAEKSGSKGCLRL